jgi:hypothetical protein
MSDDRDRHVALAVPGLFGPAAAGGGDQGGAARTLTEGLSLPALERFFSRSTRHPVQCPEDGLAAMLFGCFGVAREGPDWPVAAVTRRVDAGGADSAWVLRADPVHLRAGMGELVLTDGAELAISAAEAASLAAEINAQLDDPGLRLEPLAPKRWYLRLDEAPRLATRAPWDVVGAPVGESLATGDDAARWRTLLNDIQMILHASPVNHARERRGELPVNSLWPWGGGYMPRVPVSAWQGVWSDEVLAAGLALMAGTDSQTLPADARGWLVRATSPGRHLLVSCAGYVAARSCDVDAWRRFIGGIERDWMAPFLDALASGQVASVELHAGGPLAFRLGRRRLRHWWRRTAPFARVMASAGRLAAQQK